MNMDLGPVGILVRDFEGMVAFYQRVFGFLIEELRQWTEALCRSQPGFQSIEDWRRKLVQRVELARKS
jgi:catechol 2,3-dioxygenase-like lactoylglutathione lyase family enzyme